MGTALIALAAFCAVVFSTLLMVATRFGLGMSNEAVSAQNMRAILKVCPPLPIKIW
jgi:hypothetical protein